ncbi:MAG: chromosome segregation protein SMC [Candidatus Methylacidiphilales bacterium]|nr:chromosome segregation protein SMC [Candidatus Methylacidiphilales bacterium]
MYLQSLEVVGFKSFAEPTKISFDRGVTAIVGPNGCGKSNVLDSIRWVLGEQSAKALRGGNMQDVIFSGTDSRRALGMAEVTMHFAECEKELGTDFHEVRITRRVFRDGRSEYEINKTPCRLKDIHNLFMDTGIGRSAYSIMEQGKIDKILSAKPDDRREVFEEAAGITRFKSQKKEALRKLEATESNLIRVGDIVKELSRQIGSLQRQAGKARRFKEVHTRLKYLDTRLAGHLYAEMRARLDAGESRVQGLQMEFKAIQQDLEQQESDLSVKRQRAEQLEQELRALHQQKSLAESNVEKARQAIRFNDERITEFLALQEKNRAEIAASGEKVADLQGQVARMQAEEDSMQAVLARLGEELAVLQTAQEEARKRVSDNLKQRSILEQKLNQTDKQLNTTRQRIAALELQQNSFIVRVEKLGEEEKILSARGRELEDKLAESRARLDKHQQAHQNRLDEVVRLTAARDEAGALLERARKDAELAASEATRKEARYHVLSEVLGSRSGYSESTKTLLGKFQGPGISGTLLDHMEIKSGYEKAIQRALGAAWEALIIESPDALRAVTEAIRGVGATVVVADLFSQNPGSAESRSFIQRLGQTLFGAKTADARASSIDAARAAMSFVTAQSRVRNLVERILEEFLVAADAAEAEELRRLHPGCHIVSRDGEVWFRNGLQIRGSDSSALAAIVEQEKEWKVLQAELPGHKQKAEKAQAASDLARARLDEAESVLDRTRKQSQEEEGGLVSARFECEALERQLQEWRNSCETVSREKTHLSQQQTSEQGGRDGLEAQVRGMEAERLALAGEVDSLIVRLGELNQEVEEHSQRVTEARIRQAAQQQKAQTIHQELVIQQNRLQEVEKARLDREQEIGAYEVRILECLENSGRAEQEIEACARQSGELEQTLAIRENERREVGRLLGEIEETARIGRRKAGEVQGICGREEVQVAEQRMHLNALVERIHRAYEIDLATWDPATAERPRPEGATPAPKARWTPSDADVALAAPAKDVLASLPVPAPLEGEGTAVNGQATSAPDAGSETADAGSDPAATAVEADPVSQPERVVEVEVEEDPLLVEPVDWQAVANEVNELRERIDRMGPVNVEAITEYEELEQRLSFLAGQEKDLLRARDQLHEAIKKINETTRVLFSETFAKIKANFSEMFVELFGGGKADLNLQDDADPLECGIEIVARPPGKQLQSITLLSGGEKTMTAVALLFAIYMVKPSPFCFLDEMDAPLDESNINRFIRILQRFVTQSQFVVITHNKRTISSADVLYGVTMEEHGVSKIVSVRLNRKEESPLFNGNGGDDTPPSIADSIRHGALVTESQGSRESEAPAELN